jgi:pilus assembly protein TadC
VIAPIAATAAVLLVALGVRPQIHRWATAVRLVGTAVVAVVVTGHVLGGAAAVVALELGRRRRRARAAAQAAAQVAGAVPELIDLFRLAAAAGLPVPSALGAVAERAPPPVSDQMADGVRRLSRGLPLDEVLAQLASDLGPPSRSLVAALRHSAATGVALGPALGALAERERSARRAATRAAIGRLTVTMVLPLVCCILPAAVVVAVVPVVVVSLAELAG